MTEYTITKKFNSKVKTTPRVTEVAEAFGIGVDDKEFVIYDELKIRVNEGDVVYITGQSGSGKSLLLKELAKQMTARFSVANIDQFVLDDSKPLIDQVGRTMNDSIRLLSLAGINDAYLLIRKPSELSDGQRYRLLLAKLIESNAEVWVADEFCANLDRITAKVVAFSMQKIARKLGKTLLVATTHEDLNKELGPNLRVIKHFMDRLSIETFEKPSPVDSKPS